MRWTPNPGLFLGLVAGILAITSISVPWPGRFSDPGGGEEPSSTTPVRCFRLSYEGTSYSWLPRNLRLLPQVYFSGAPDGVWFRTESDGRVWGWRPAGRDSIDLMAHHGPALRIPTKGDTLIGRGGWPEHGSLLEVLFSKEWRVHAVAVPCTVGE